MKLLFIGDIFGRVGRETVKEFLPSLIEEEKIDFVVANAENMSHGSGFTPGHIAEMQGAGVDFFTTGNHFMSKKDGVAKMSDPKFPVIRPANYPPLEEIPGEGWRVVEEKDGRKILIVNLMGRAFMKKSLDCPFRKMDEILGEVNMDELAAIFVDFHAETTSEKEALGYYLDGRVSAFVGTHTHVPTADCRILANGTAYMSDVGMSGSLDSVIGVKKDLIIHSFLTQMKVKHEPETEGQRVFNAILIELDDASGKAVNSTHVQKFK